MSHFDFGKQSDGAPTELEYRWAICGRSDPPSPGAEREASCVAVYEKELDYLFETLQRLGASPREIEDLAHEVFLVLLRNWSDLDLSRPFRPYLFAIAFRVVCAHRRRRRREVPYAYLDAEDQAIGPEESLQSKESIFRCGGGAICHHRGA